MYHGKFEAKNRPSTEKAENPPVRAENPPVKAENPPVKAEKPPVKAPRKTAHRKKKKSRIGSIIFYCIYFLLIAAFFMALFGALNKLEDFLIQYEGSQPNVKCQEVFDSLFRSPDWKKIYALANETDTAYDSAESYAAYMTQKVGSNTLTYSETSAGLSGDHKYIVKSGSEKVAVFTLTSDSDSDSESDTEIRIKEWKLGNVELFYERTASVTVRVQPGRTVTVNGIALDESHIISSTSTLAEEYLPEGVHGYRMQELYVDDLLVAPQVAVTDESGNAVEMAYDEATASYTEVIPTQQITDQRDTIVSAVQTYGKFMIEAASRNQLAKYFDSDEQAYKFITRSEVFWTQNYNGYDFTEAEITDFYRYSDSLFSVHVNMTMNVTRSNGSIKEFLVASTFFFRNTGSKWLVTEMTNIDVQQQQTKVRLTYMQDDTMISSKMVESDATTLTTPPPNIPEGMVFTGWFRQTVDENGDKTMVLVFQPDNGGAVTLPSGYKLEPMTLYALFEKEA